MTTTRGDAALRADLKRLRRERAAVDARIAATEHELRQRAGLKRLRGRRPMSARDVSIDALMPIARMGDGR